MRTESSLPAVRHEPRDHDGVLRGLDTVVPEALALYLDVHANPELSGAEVRTAALLAGWLAAEGYAVTAGVGGHGVVGVLSNGPGPVVMLRAELDALPIRERTGLAYESSVVVPGPDGPLPVMHACGHDLHLAAAAGAAALLARQRHAWRGTVMAIGQPAEETLQGARAMIADGLYARFGRPDVVLAQHAAPLPAGMVAHGQGPVLAGSVSLRVVIHGRGGHASAPQLGIDPVVTAAATVLRLQTIVSRETAAADQVVLTVGSLHAGTLNNVANVVPDTATLGISVRAWSDEALDRATRAVGRIVRAECAASGCLREPDFTVTSRSPVTLPYPAAAATVRRAHEARFGPSRVCGWPGSMSTEDVAFLADPPPSDPDAPRVPHPAGVPIVYWMLGTASPRQWAGATGASAWERLRTLPANHSAEYAPDVRLALPAGIEAMAVAALAHLPVTG